MNQSSGIVNLLPNRVELWSSSSSWVLLIGTAWAGWAFPYINIYANRCTLKPLRNKYNFLKIEPSAMTSGAVYLQELWEWTQIIKYFIEKKMDRKLTSDGALRVYFDKSRLAVLTCLQIALFSKSQTRHFSSRIYWTFVICSLFYIWIHSCTKIISL